MPGKAIIILLLGFIIITGLVLAGIYSVNNSISQNMTNDFQRKATYNIAQSGANIGLRQLTDNSGYRNSSYSVSTMMNGKVNVRVVDTTLSDSSTWVAVKSTGYTNYGGTNQISCISIALMHSNSIPIPMKGAYTSPAGVTYSFNGGGEIDGRNYTSNNTLISPGGTGTFAIWTKGTVNIPGNSASLGGTANGVDYPLSSSINPLIVLQNQPIPATYPNTPDEAMGGSTSGYPEGTLKTYAKSGSDGSQYIQSVGGSIGSYNSTFSGVTFIDWNGGNLSSLSGSGILVINNLSTQMLSLQIKKTNFSGILILSNNTSLDLKQGGVIGDVIVLGSNGVNSSLLSDNGQGFIHFSSQSVLNSIKNIVSKNVVWYEK